MFRLSTILAIPLLFGITPAEAQSYPQVRTIGGGNTEVRVSRYCRILYNKRGSRELTSRDCSSRDIRYAGQLAREHRRDEYAQGLPSTRPQPGLNYPFARDVYGNRVEVNVNRNCRVIYDARGDRESATRGCSRRDQRRADNIFRDFRGDRPGYGDNGYRPGGGSDFAWLRGRDADNARDVLEDRNFDRVDRWRPDYGGRYSMWWNARSRQCLRMYERDGRVRELFPTDPRDCRG